MNTQAQRLLHNSYKAQALLQHDGTWYQFITYMSALVDSVYIFYLLDYCWPQSNASLSDQSSIVSKHERHLETPSDKYQHAFVDFRQQHIQYAERTRRQIAEIEHENRFGPAQAGAHSADRPVAPSASSSRGGGDGAGSDKGTPSTPPESERSDERAGEDSNSASDLQASPSIKELKAELARVVKIGETPADINNVLAQLNDALSSSKDKMSLPYKEFSQVFTYQHIDDKTKNLCLTMFKMYVKQKGIVNKGPFFNICGEELESILEKNFTSSETLHEMLSALTELRSNSTAAGRG